MAPAGGGVHYVRPPLQSGWICWQKRGSEAWYSGVVWEAGMLGRLPASSAPRRGGLHGVRLPQCLDRAASVLAAGILEEGFGVILNIFVGCRIPVTHSRAPNLRGQAGLPSRSGRADLSRSTSAAVAIMGFAYRVAHHRLRVRRLKCVV